MRLQRNTLITPRHLLASIPPPVTPARNSRKHPRVPQHLEAPAVADNVSIPPAPSDSAADLLPDRLVWPGRTHNCGELRGPDVGQQVSLCGWIDRNRDLGGVQFIDLRDHTGIMQVGSPVYVAMHVAMHVAIQAHCIEGAK